MKTGMWGRYVLVFIVSIAVVLFSGCGDDDVPKMVPGKFERLWKDQVLRSTLLNRSIDYAVLLPEGYDESEESYPVVYLLHGYGDDETAWYTNGGLQYYVDQNITQTVPMIYVMPQAFNSYYIDRYNGNFPYMEMFATELVAEIDTRFRTKKDKTQRAVMGYSMGGYGALILPAMHPDVFGISIPLSMSFRTDEQYMAESPGSFSNQWAPNFGPSSGATGVARLSPYFKERSPFHFFNQENTTAYNNLKILVDCGDDEESLTFTSNSMHSLMRDNNIAHEYRVRSGGHSFDYWKKSYPEALKFISNAVQGIQHPTEPVPAPVGTLLTASDYTEVDVSGTTVNILTPVDYATTTLDYPVLYFIHSTAPADHDQNLIKTFSMLRNGMTASKVTKSILVEILVDETADTEFIETVVSYIDENYRTKDIRDNRVIMGNGLGAQIALQAANTTNLFSDCFIYNAQLPDIAQEVSSTVFYYLDITDKGESYRGYENLYTKIRNDGTDGYEYRVRQGSESYQSFLNGLTESFSFLKESLNR
jgi:enterochelin esterase-like enzyme